MARKAKALLGPSRLAQALARLKQEPQPFAPNLKSLRLTYAYRNDHFGARHFVKEDLPRIRYANPSINVYVDKKPKTKEETWNPEMVVELHNGGVHRLNMGGKWSTTIFSELMDVSAGPWWRKWKANMPPPPTIEPAPKPRATTGAAAVLP